MDQYLGPASTGKSITVVSAKVDNRKIIKPAISINQVSTAIETMDHMQIKHLQPHRIGKPDDDTA